MRLDDRGFCIRSQLERRLRRKILELKEWKIVHKKDQASLCNNNLIIFAVLITLNAARETGRQQFVKFRESARRLKLVSSVVL